MFYTHNIGSPGTSSIVLQAYICGLPKNLVEVYTSSGGSHKKPPKRLHTFWWIVSNQWLDLYTWWSTKNKEMAYTKMGVSPTINVLVYAHVGGSPHIKVYPFILVGS